MRPVSLSAYRRRLVDAVDHGAVRSLPTNTVVGGYIGAFFTPELTAGLTSTYGASAAELRMAFQELYRSDFAGGYELAVASAAAEEPYADRTARLATLIVWPMGASTDLSHVVFVAGEGSFGVLPA